MRNKKIIIVYYIIPFFLFLSGCSKLLEVKSPVSSVTSSEMFSSNQQAELAVNGIYSKMVNGSNASFNEGMTIPDQIFSSGLSTILGGLSADELTAPSDLNNTNVHAMNNKLTIANSAKTAEIWFSAYRSIFDANAVLEGLEGSKAGALTDSARKQFMGEALALRAFCYFYLVNFFGDVPLLKNADFKIAQSIARTPQSQVYAQIKADLVNARTLLGNNFSAGNGERVRVCKWFAEAMLARVYLYTGEYLQAINSANEVINHTALFKLETDVSKVFLPGSEETIFELKPASENTFVVNGTPEGYTLYENPPTIPTYKISGQLSGAFEPNDHRKQHWTTPVGSDFVAAKYTRNQKRQYYIVMRLAELYLIRAEATILHTPAAKNDAISDLNVLRRRAGLTELDEQLTVNQITEAIEHERRIELFVEWGHRWFDLKRTGKARELLSSVAYKQPWLGDYQLLYPIPPTEIKANSYLIQNDQYRL